MTNRTIGIIKACRGYVDLPDVVFEDYRINWVRYWLAQNENRLIGYYTDDIMNSIMFEALCEYLDVVEKPSVVLKKIEGKSDTVYFSRADKIIGFFAEEAEESLRIKGINSVIVEYREE